MSGTSVVIMEKDMQTGYLDKELGSYTIEHDTNVIERIFAVSEEGKRIVNLFLTVPGEFEDWEFNAILDNYDLELYKEKVLSIEEDEESYNPSWIIRFEYMEDHNSMEEKLNDIMETHDNEIKRVLELIKDLADEYRD